MPQCNTANIARRSFVSALIAAAAPLNGAIANLYQDPVGSSPTVVLSDFVVATFDGYAASAALTWGAVGTDTLNLADVTAQEVEWVPTGTTTPNTIAGGFITNAAGTALLFWEEFDTPIAVNGPPDVVRWVPKFQLPLQNI
jgi:hypothetical protein